MGVQWAGRVTSPLLTPTIPVTRLAGGGAGVRGWGRQRSDVRSSDALRLPGRATGRGRWLAGLGSQESESGSCRWRGRCGGAGSFGAGTYERDSVRWKRCRRPRNMTNELGGKERADTSQRGPSKAPPAGHWQRKPPSGPFAQVPPLRQTPGTQRPASVSSSQSSPRGSSHGRRRSGQPDNREGSPGLDHPRSQDYGLAGAFPHL